MHFDQAKADRVIQFVRSLKHTKGKWAGVPFTLLPWQEQALRDIFGTVRENGLRQYTMAYIEIAKKQGKSELGAALALQGLCADDEWAAEVYGCAGDRQQASIIFDVAVAMVEQNPVLKKHITPILSQKRLVYTPTNSFYQVLSAEAYSKHGLNASRVIFDEVHSQPKRDLWDVMTEGSGDAREQPLVIALTTAGDDPDRGSIGWEVHQMAIEVLTGKKHDPTFYSMVYGLDRENRRIWKGREWETIEEDVEDDAVWRKIWSDPKIWQAVNPSIGHTISEDKVVDQYNRALGNPSKEKNFRWLRLNSWERIKTGKWLSVDFWDLCKAKIDEKRFEGRPCYGGLDLSSKIDLTAFVLLFPPDDINPKWTVIPRFWLPEDAIPGRVEKDKVKYDIWAEQGFLQTTPGNVIDYRFIREEILRLRDRFDIRQIGFDPWNAMQTATELQDEGLEMVEVRQGYKTMSPAMKEIQKLVMGKEIQHSGHPVLRWNVDNTQIKMDENENIRPVKGKGIERIDGLVAMVNAMVVALLNQDEEFVYNSRGMRSLL
jgi:phage terminase large subunit-like protein